VIAHRGASHFAPENTMAAFSMAYQMQSDMIELDVLLSKDGVPVVIHDLNLKRTTNGTGKVSEHSLKELKFLDAGLWFSDKFRSEKIPELDEVLSWASGKISLNIEIKTEAVTDTVQNGIVEKTVNLVRKHQMEKHVIFSSFDYRALVHLQNLAPELPKGVLYDRKQAKGMEPVELVQHYHADAFHSNWRSLNNRRHSGLLEEKIPVFVYTVNSKERMEKLIKNSVSGIFSNRPDLLKSIADRDIENRCTS
jgi:glycerophosphoryl diester phosphodiesterase